MGAVLADTHAIIWYMRSPERLSSEAQRVLDSSDPVLVSCISVVEAIYLADKGRLPPSSYAKLTEALGDAKTNVEAVPLDFDLSQAVRLVSRDIVPDMPDRIIAATALYLGVPLVTRDRRIRAADVPTVW